MRYIIQGMVMLGDVLFWTAMGGLIYFGLGYFQNPLVLLIFILVGARAFQAWKQDGFIAWHPSNIRKFLANAKKAGL
jgi:hypothetical protein